jgi:hypothetical protein
MPTNGELELHLDGKTMQKAQSDSVDGKQDLLGLSAVEQSQLRVE